MSFLALKKPHRVREERVGLFKGRSVLKNSI